jgi:hypothetical protein
MCVAILTLYTFELCWHTATIWELSYVSAHDLQPSSIHHDCWSVWQDHCENIYCRFSPQHMIYWQDGPYAAYGHNDCVTKCIQKYVIQTQLISSSMLSEMFLLVLVQRNNVRGKGPVCAKNVIGVMNICVPWEMWSFCQWLYQHSPSQMYDRQILGRMY